MRALAAMTLVFVLSSLAGALAADAPATNAQPPKPAATASTAPPTATSNADAAARHAKRTACRKEAAGKKLVGDEKSGYVKSCMAK